MLSILFFNLALGRVSCSSPGSRKGEAIPQLFLPGPLSMSWVYLSCLVALIDPFISTP